MTGLDSLGWQIHDHLKEHRPKMFLELKSHGTLNATVLQMQNNANEQMQVLENAGTVPPRGVGDRERRGAPADRGGRAESGGDETAIHGLTVSGRVSSC